VPNLLALETSSAVCSVALLSSERLDCVAALAGQSHSGMLLDMVRKVLSEAELELADCAAIAFGAGPGSFTGLRIACSVAQGLAWGQDLPVVPVGTLTAMAEECRRAQQQDLPKGTRVLVAQDARMGEIYWSVLAWQGGRWSETIGPSLSAPKDLEGAVGRDIAFGCGNAFELFPAELVPLVGTVSGPLVPDARAIAQVALGPVLAGEVLAASLARPLYIRDRVALTSDERASRALAPS
jgi:tRNA threonylcarbamoyladenosine biosynthesis protein TsaB